MLTVEGKTGRVKAQQSRSAAVLAIVLNQHCFRAGRNASDCPDFYRSSLGWSRWIEKAKKKAKKDFFLKVVSQISRSFLSLAGSWNHRMRVCMCVSERERVRAGVCVCARDRDSKDVWVCVVEWAGERESGDDERKLRVWMSGSGGDGRECGWVRARARFAMGVFGSL